MPFIDEQLLLGGFYTPGAGVVDSLRAATIMRERAQEAGMTVSANTEVLGLDVEHGRIRRVRTDRGDIEADRVVIACGCWSPRIAGMAGAKIPLTPAVHQMIDIGPVPRFADPKTLVDYPIVRDMDTNMYERQDGTGLEIGSYAHRPILMDADEIPSIEESALSPTELPFTQADFELQMEQALELMPEIVGDESVGQRYAINGLLSVTHDGMPLIGETPEVKGLWSAAAIWIKEGPGAGKTVAELMVHGESEIDVYDSNIARAYPHQKTKRPHPGAGQRGLQQDVRDRPSLRAVGVRPPRQAAARTTSASRSSRPSSTRRRAGSARSGMSQTRRCSRSSATASAGARPSGTRAGGRRSSTPSTWRCATEPATSISPRLRSSTSPDRRRSTPSSGWRCARWTSPSAGSSTRRC